MRCVRVPVVAVVLALVAAAPAQAAKRCDEPRSDWQRATPAEAGMDAAKLQDAMDYGTSQSSFAVRAYRHGCLVAEDRFASQNRNSTYESWSMAKSVTSLVFGRAMQLGLVSPDDPVGSLVPEADGPHGTITLHDLLTMTSGLRWNGFHDYNIFTMPDRVRDALTLEVVHPPGTFYEYAQSAVSLLAEATARAVGDDFERFAQRELMGPLEIEPGTWHWERDRAGHVAGFYGVNMRPDDFGRLGELLRRDGVWRGHRLLSAEYVRRSVAPSVTNGCYGWLIWVNAGSPCIGPTISERPVEQNRDMPDLPADLYRFSGLFGQLVTVFPTQGIVVVRTGQDPGLVPAGGQDWEHELYKRVLAAVTDQPVEPAGDAPPSTTDDPDTDYGFQTSLAEPDQYSKGAAQDPLPPAGPRRARAPRLLVAHVRVGRKGRLAVGLRCPPNWPSGEPGCRGVATLEGARQSLRYDVPPGTTRLVRFTLTKSRLAALRRSRTAALTAVATNEDSASGATSRLTLDVIRPAPPKKQRRRG
ncbi:MAG TPA: serine hydrolase [Solirubrobacteraceae bacterium]|nr:serine hydrolase [Solirubrobacteraceae bacterium]